MTKFKLTKTQEQFWLLQNIFKENTAYNTLVIQKIEGIPDIESLDNAYKKIISRHDIFRSIVIEENNFPFFIVKHPVSDFSVEKILVKTEFSEDSVSEELNAEIHTPFKLSEDQLIRVKLFVYPKNISVLSIVGHHLIADQKTKEIFATELAELYQAFVEGRDANLPEEVPQFEEYSIKYQNWLLSEHKQRILNNWKNYLKDGVNPVELPIDFKRNKNLSLGGERMNFKISEALSSNISEFSNKNGVSSFVTLLGIYSIFLSRLTNTREFTIGIPVTNRRYKETKDVVGCCINIVPLKVKIPEDSCFISLIKNLRREMIFIIRNQEMPLLEIIHNLRDKNINGMNGLFQTGFTFESPMELELQGLTTIPIRVERKGSQLELFLSFYERNRIFYGTFEFATDLFKRETIEHWKEIYISLAESALKNSECKITNLDILPQQERAKLIEWNATDSVYEDSTCLHQKFENQAKNTPNAIALTYYDTTLTYSELNTQANRLAHYLIERGMSVEDKIGICINRSPEMIIAILATLKAGGAYVPFDTQAPVERNQAVTEDAGLKFIISTKESGKNLNNFPGTIYIDNLLKENISENTTNPSTGVTPRNLAYIIYTSGSTGKPKGVMIEHHSVMNKIGWIQKTYPVNPGEVLIQKTPTTFDVSVWELFWWFFNGGRLDLLKANGEKDPKEIVTRIKTTKPALLIFVPSVFSLFIDYLVATGQETCLQNIRWIILIGEALPATLVNRYNNIYKNKKAPVLINTYGPTEATVAVSWFECPVSENTNQIFIGKPIDNTKLFIVNNRNQIQPIGIPGELVITGANLARGYRNAPELTSEKFISLKLPDGNTTRAYKTGDLAKWDPSGELDFIGRVDNQVKIRGMRIELGDIEAKLQEHPNVKEAAVIVTKGKSENKILLGYIVSNEAMNGRISEVKEFLQKKLPPHMIPTQIIELDKMPLTSSGKINRKQLPVPDFNSTSNFIPPSSQVESQLVEIWKKLLNLDKISISENFFELGGDSMLAVTMVTKIKQHLNIEVDVLKILEYPNIKALANFLSNNEQDSNKALSDVEKRAMLRKSLNKAKSRRFIF